MWRYGLYSPVRYQVLMAAILKMTAFWDIAPCSLVEGDRQFRGCTASIIKAMMEYAPLKRRSISTILHDAISQKAVIIICIYLAHIGV
jgi:hypothetical protein